MMGKSLCGFLNAAKMEIFIIIIIVYDNATYGL